MQEEVKEEEGEEIVTTRVLANPLESQRTFASNKHFQHLFVCSRRELLRSYGRVCECGLVP
jgi:hypothetical protein